MPRSLNQHRQDSSPKHPRAWPDLPSRHVVLICLCFFLCGCHTSRATNEPSIEVGKIPPAAEGGRERVDSIAGRVIGARPGQRVVVYAKSGPWWVQPWPDQAFIEINSGGEWSTPTHLGYEYAALLVEPAYHPPPTMDVAPTKGGSVVAVAIVKGVGSLPPIPTRSIRFSGYDWKVRTISSDRGGLNNLFDSDNAWTDPGGALHLRITKKAGRWMCSEVDLTRSLGYGSYITVVRDTSHLEPAAVLQLLTFDDSGGVQHFREMDVEVGRWGEAARKSNAQYAVQPFYVPGNVAPFTEPSGTLTHLFRWEPGTARFETVRGSSLRPGAPVISQHVFTSGVPSPSQESFQFIFYVVASDRTPMQKESEVVIEKFEYLP